MESIITIVSLPGNAGAGGVAMATACDYVVAAHSSVLNPHYRNMGLHGSEFWTYSFVRRVGAELAEKLTMECLPLIGSEAAEMKLVDYSVERSQISDFIMSNLINPDHYE